MKKYFIPIISFLCLYSCIDYSTDSGLPPTDEPISMENNEVRLWLTTGALLNAEVPVAYTTDITDLVVKINSSETYQTIDGFGGTLTGSSAYLFMQMTAEARTQVLKSLFHPKEGAGLESLRIAIGASDFSMALYTYCDKKGLENFAIPEIDKRDLLPVLKEILAINPNVKIIASPWSPPAWMKSSNNLNYGSLIGAEIYDDYANYFVKYIQAMKAEGITIDAITLQNESDFESKVHPSMKLSPTEQATIIGKYLGPKLKNAGITTKILILDHNFDIYQYAIDMLNNEDANPYINGTAFHGYAGDVSAIKMIRQAFPDKSVYQTELSGGEWNTGSDMETMFYYVSTFMVPSLQNGSSNFMMFNIALNSEHGPVTPGGTFCEDCRGIVTVDGDKFEPELEYHMLSHFGKICRSGAKLLKTNSIGSVPDKFTTTAFLNPDGSRGLLVVNQSGNNVNLTIKDELAGKRVVYNVPNSSIASFMFQK